MFPPLDGACLQSSLAWRVGVPTRNSFGKQDERKINLMGVRSSLQDLRSMRYGVGLILAAVIVALPLAPTARAEDDALEITLGKGGLRAQTADGQFKFKFGGRVHADGTIHAGDQPANGPLPTDNRTATDGVELRRARFHMKATVYEDYHWVGQIDFADNKTAVKDFLLGYTGLDGVKLTVGNQKQPYSLALEMSSNDSPFVEQPIDVSLVSRLLDRAIGGRVDANGENWFFAGGFYGDGVAAQKDNQVEGFGAAAKWVYAPVIEEDSLVHIGFRGAFRRPETNNEAISFSTETTHMSNYNPVLSGTIEDVDGVVLFGPEFALACGPFSIFGEYNRAIVLRRPGNRVNFDAFHVGATFSLTGESRAASYTIESAEFKRLKPRRNFSLKQGGSGAWEVGVRYAYLDLGRGIMPSSGDTELPGGMEQAISIALNWYLNHNVRVMWNYRHILETDEGSTDPAGVVNQEAAGLSMFTTRVQFAF